MRRRNWQIGLGLALTLAGCDQLKEKLKDKLEEKKDSSASSKPADVKQPASSATKPASTGGAATGDASTADLPQPCQDYLKSFDACAKNVPEAGKAAWDQGGKVMKDSFAQANTPEAKQALATGCKTALDALAQNPLCKGALAGASTAAGTAPAGGSPAAIGGTAGSSGSAAWHALAELQANGKPNPLLKGVYHGVPQTGLSLLVPQHYTEGVKGKLFSIIDPNKDVIVISGEMVTVDAASKLPSIAADWATKAEVRAAPGAPCKFDGSVSMFELGKDRLLTQMVEDVCMETENGKDGKVDLIAMFVPNKKGTNWGKGSLVLAGLDEDAPAATKDVFLDILRSIKKH